ncbi:MAG: DUF2723 domain-containing protein [Chloroflexi bacterium]|nr:DUF2723 domain-containing protein [Chloroflexota bacterium]
MIVRPAEANADHVAGEPTRPGFSLRPVDPARFALASAAVVTIILVTRLPLAAEMLFHWDSGNYALAIENYNVASHQPHPPGYPLYVATAWLVHQLVGEANRSYVLLSVAGSAAAAVAVLGFAWRLFGPRVGVLASILFITSPTVWSHGEVALPYVFLALFSALIGWCVVETRWGGRNLTLPGAALLGMGGGFRPDLLMWLSLPWLYGSFRRLRWLVAGGAAVLVIVAAWAIPMAQLSGGWQAYATATQQAQEMWGPPASTKRAFVEHAQMQAERTRDHIRYALGPALFFLAYGLVRMAAQPRALGPAAGVPLLFALMVTPSVLFFVFVHITNPGYILAITVPLLLLAAKSADVLATDLAKGLRQVLGSPTQKPLAFAIVAPVALWNAGIFLLAPGEGSLEHIRAHDSELKPIVEHIRSHHESGSTIVISGAWGIRHLEYYLPDFRTAHHLMSTMAIQDADGPTDVPDGVTTAVVVNDAVEAAEGDPGVDRIDFPPGASLSEVRLANGATLEFADDVLRIAGPQPGPVPTARESD